MAPRERRITVIVGEREYTRIMRYADKAGRSRSEFGRLSMLAAGEQHWFEPAGPALKTAGLALKAAAEQEAPE